MWDGRRWVPLRPLCEYHQISYRYRLTRVKKNPDIEKKLLVAPSRKGRRTKMLCVLEEHVEHALTMSCPGRGAHNQSEDVRRKLRPNYKRRGEQSW